VRSTIYHIALVTEFHLRTLAGDLDDSIPTEADLATVDDAARLLERAYGRLPAGIAGDRIGRVPVLIAGAPAGTLAGLMPATHAGRGVVNERGHLSVSFR
jgi:hypothetical protein